MTRRTQNVYLYATGISVLAPFGFGETCIAAIVVKILNGSVHADERSSSAGALGGGPARDSGREFPVNSVSVASQLPASLGPCRSDVDARRACPLRHFGNTGLRGPASENDEIGELVVVIKPAFAYLLLPQGFAPGTSHTWRGR